MNALLLQFVVPDLGSCERFENSLLLWWQTGRDETPFGVDTAHGTWCHDAVEENIEYGDRDEHLTRGGTAFVLVSCERSG